jgi:ankyrin repeat protein
MSDSSNLSPNINLEFLRKEAKHLLRQCHARDAAAIGRLRAQLPRLAALADAQIGEQIKLADVHQALAREHGYANWAELKRADDPLEQFLAAVRSGSVKRAQRALAALPDLAEESIHAACAIGEPEAVAHHLDVDPALLTRLHGGWPPLFYACGSPLNRVTQRQSADIAGCVSVLLERGADPNTHIFTDPADLESKVTAVRRALLSTNLPVMRLLVQKGAAFDPQNSLAVLQSDTSGVLEYFKKPEVQEQMRQRMAEFRDKHAQRPPLGAERSWLQPNSDWSPLSADMYRSLFQRGVDPNRLREGGVTLFHEAVQKGPVEVVELFISNGGDINRLTPDGRTPLALAIRAGKDDVAAALRAHGASDAGLRPIDELIGACLRLDAAAARDVIERHPDAATKMSSEDADILIRASSSNVIVQVKLMAECGLDLGTTAGSGITALHAAAWHGHAGLVRLLLGFHVPVNIRDSMYGSSPLAWAAHGSRACSQPEDNYCEIVTALLEAGADYESAVGRSGVPPESFARPRVAELVKGMRGNRGS